MFPELHFGNGLRILQGGSSMRSRNNRFATLSLEPLEERWNPAYLTYNTGAFTVAGLPDNGVANGYSLSATKTTTSAQFNGPDGNPQVVNSMPLTAFTQDPAPTQAEWNVLFAQFPGTNWNWASSAQTLSDNTLTVKDAEALDPSKAAPGVNVVAVAQSLFIQYTANGNSPPADNNLHWLEFVTTNTAPFSLGGANGTPGVDTKNNTTPFYDVSGFSANSTGFADIPARLVQNASITWSADLFVVQSIPNGAGGTTNVVWQGVSWGWQTLAVKKAPPPPGQVVTPDGGENGEGNNGTDGRVSNSDANGSVFLLNRLEGSELNPNAFAGTNTNGTRLFGPMPGLGGSTVFVSPTGIASTPFGIDRTAQTTPSSSTEPLVSDDSTDMTLPLPPTALIGSQT
jgi:hypothetical protein